jgi:cysteinyl-tRNA synthetase
MVLKIYNTLGRELEEFKPLDPKQVSFYQCGPTVYWTQHIGNIRAAVVADLVRRSLNYLGYPTQFVRNYTDVGHFVSDGDEGEDKMEKGAKREGKTPQEIADKYISIFEADTAAVNVLDPDFKPRATENIPEMIAMVQNLLDKGFAYSTPLAIYFDVSKAPNYTALSGQNLEENLAGQGRSE